MKTPSRIAILGLAGIALAWVAWVRGVSPAGGQDEREVIAAKTRTERDQLERRYEEFNHLSAVERDEILKIHRFVQEAPELAKSLEEYTKFIAGLEPWERERLESEADPAKRIAEVDRLLDAKNEHRGGTRHADWMTGETVRGTTYKSDDFQAILERLTSMLDLPVSTDAKKGSVEWQLWTVQRLAAKWRSDEFKTWPPSGITNQMLEKLPSDRFRDFLLNSDRFDEQERRSVLAAMLARTLMARWQRELSDRIPKDEMREAVTSLKDREQRDGMWEDPGRLQAAMVEALEGKAGPIGIYAQGYGEARELYREFDPFPKAAGVVAQAVAIMTGGINTGTITTGDMMIVILQAIR